MSSPRTLTPNTDVKARYGSTSVFSLTLAGSKEDHLATDSFNSLLLAPHQCISKDRDEIPLLMHLGSSYSLCMLGSEANDSVPDFARSTHMYLAGGSGSCQTCIVWITNSALCDECCFPFPTDRGSRYSFFPLAFWMNKSICGVNVAYYAGWMIASDVQQALDALLRAPHVALQSFEFLMSSCATFQTAVKLSVSYAMLDPRKWWRFCVAEWNQYFSLRPRWRLPDWGSGSCCSQDLYRSYPLSCLCRRGRRGRRRRCCTMVKTIGQDYGNMQRGTDEEKRPLQSSTVGNQSQTWLPVKERRMPTLVGVCFTTSSFDARR